jgi:hypothetical protein
MEQKYEFYKVWGLTYESDERWHMGRFDEDTDHDQAFEIVRDSLNGGVGGDMSEVLEIENGYDDGLYTDYITEEL